MAFISEEAAKQIEEQIKTEAKEQEVASEAASEEGPFDTQGADHAIDSLSGMMYKMSDWWKTIRGDLYYYSSGHGFEQTHPKAREKLKKVMDLLDKFFDAETNLRGKGSLPVAVKQLEAIKKIK